MATIPRIGTSKNAMRTMIAPRRFDRLRRIMGFTL
jgi:hypothetical protein